MIQIFPEHPMLVQAAASFFIVIGLSMIMGMRKKLLLIAGIGGVSCWIIFQLMSMTTDRELFAYTIASAAAFLYCEFLTATIRTPATIFYAPAIIPMIPGKSIYYAVSGALSEDWPTVWANTYLVFEAVLGLAIGIMIMFTVMLMIKKKAHIG